MPAGPTSLQNYQASNYTAMAPGNVYKNAIDANSAILSPFGMFYTYPNSPTGMSVLVDDAFNFIQPGSGYVLQPTASAVAVALAAPGVNPYYATIYWNSLTNAFGVIYGAQAASPTVLLPDDAAWIPLAAVLLSVGQITVTAANIVDLRSWFRFGPLRYDNIALNSTVTVNCAGASSVDLNLHASGASANLTLSNLQVGVRLQIIWRDAPNNIVFAAKTPGGVAYTTRAKKAGTVTSFAAFSQLGTGLTAGTDALLLADTYYSGTTPFWDAAYQ
jgi:hypothetical protein